MQRRRCGFTLPECLMAAAILSFAVAAIAQAIVSGQMQVEQALHDQRAVAIGSALLEEIIAKPYHDPDGGENVLGPEAGESARGAFDNSDDYHGYSDAAGELVDAQDSAYPQTYQVFSRSVTMTAGSVVLGSFVESVGGLNVTVTVTDQTGRQWQVQRFIPNPGDA